MIIWDDNIIYDAKSASRAEKIKKRLKQHKLTAGLNYCVAISNTEGDQLDIINMAELLFKYYSASDIPTRIVGVASSKQGAIDIAASIVENVYNKTGTTDIRFYYGVYDKES